MILEIRWAPPKVPGPFVLEESTEQRYMENKRWGFIRKRCIRQVVSISQQRGQVSRSDGGAVQEAGASGLFSNFLCMLRIECNSTYIFVYYMHRALPATQECGF